MDEIKVEKSEKKPFEHKFKKFNKSFQKHKRFNNKYRLQAKELDDKQIKKYQRGDVSVHRGKIRTSFFKHKFLRQEQKFNFASKHSARAEILLNEGEGFIIPDEGEETIEYTQDDIKKNVDITSASKSFNLNLDFGPYNLNYTRNGRHLVIGGKKGHIAAFDWISKKLYCEFNVMEEVVDVKWLHLETMFAVAQKKWVHFYDNKGTEIHCVKKMNDVNQLEFLPYHFLLVSGDDKGWLKWLDVSIGEMVAEFPSLDDKITIMRQNPSNAVTCIASAKGVVSMWAPANHRQTLARILCHPAPLTALAFNVDGTKMVTAGMDKKVKLWDTRMFQNPVAQYHLNSTVHNITISQKNVMAVAMGEVCEIFRNINVDEVDSYTKYLRHIELSPIKSLQFVPYEDVMGIGSKNGFSSILVPGSGEANFDTLEQNPFRTKLQRREHEVKLLLEKIPAELITLDTSQIVNVDVDRMEERFEAKPEVHIPITKLNERKKARSGVEKSKIKQKQHAEEKQHLLKAAKQEELREKKKHKKSQKSDKEESNVLDRFKKKSKK
ncbi:hypothetical protein PVAND_002687 [Polypedilum vanderplanki]|uniref:BING4 C-terminal domain-containing protein n=1 Tax=Polypedilum vanderplanki TaxID=319348 RepID=A0A9J6BS52_POLVA|nr:hypothetical protein PVAND_002687 [Polypedilum vanderplanki]